jgi:hypothetical protein
MNTTAELEELAGSELSAICFVRDYVELHFDGPVLRIFSSPIVVEGDTRYEFPQDGSRDALCRLIGRVVESAVDQPDQLVIRCAADSVIEVPKASRDAGPEIAHFVPTREGRRDVASITTWENLIPTR